MSYTANFPVGGFDIGTNPAPPGIPSASLRPRQVTKLLVDDEELPHHAQVLMIENVTVVHVRSIVIGVGVEA